MSSAVNYITLGMLTVDSKKKYTVHWALIIYYAIAIMTMISVGKWLFSLGQPIAGGLSLVLLFVIYVFFALRWFINQPSSTPKTTTDSCGNTSTSSQNSASSFPPIVNMCPDFMVVWTDPDTRNVYCYDDKNTYNMKSYNNAGLTTGLTINNVTGQSAYLIKNPSQNTGATSLSTDSGNTRWPFLGLLTTNLATMTNDPFGKYLRWEGVWDGSTLTAANAPLP